ncbi:MAG: YciI family protein [Planctomycetota bacterium]
MYAIILRYKVPLHEVDRHVDAHRAWLREHYAAGHFLLSGAQRPRVGGFILAAAMARAKLDAILAGDAFKTAGVADHEVIDVAATTSSPELAFLAEQP